MQQHWTFPVPAAATVGNKAWPYLLLENEQGGAGGVQLAARRLGLLHPKEEAGGGDMRQAVRARRLAAVLVQVLVSAGCAADAEPRSPEFAHHAARLGGLSDDKLILLLHHKLDGALPDDVQVLADLVGTEQVPVARHYLLLQQHTERV